MYPQAADASGPSRGWDELRPGHLVIAHKSPADGWWEAIVLERKDDAFTLQFRDYTDLPHVVRHKSGIALMHPPTEETQPADRRSRPDARPRPCGLEPLSSP